MDETTNTTALNRNAIRFSLFLIILPLLYIGLWISISADDSLSYLEQVNALMSYFPEPIRNPYGITLALFGMSLSSASLSFLGYLKSKNRKAQIIQIAICVVASVLTIWLGISLL